MLSYYIKHAYRIFRKDKIHAILNILGLSVGLTSGILVLLYLYTAKNFNTYFENHENIYRYGVEMQIGDSEAVTQSTSNAAAAPLLKAYMPGIESYTRCGNIGPLLMRHQNNAIYESAYTFADSTFFTIFSHEFIHGNSKTCLSEMSSIALSETASQKYFGDKNPLGKIIEVENMGNFKVTGVFKDLPDNTHFYHQMVLSFSNLLQLTLQRFNMTEKEFTSPKNLGGGMLFRTYFLFNKEFKVKDFDYLFKKFYDEHMAESDKINYKGVVEPVSDILLNSTIWPDFSARNKRVLIGFSSLGILILILTCINYINLITAKSESRALEVGIKKQLERIKKRLFFNI